MSSKETTPAGEIKPSENASQKNMLLEGKNSLDDKGSNKTNDPIQKEFNVENQLNPQPSSSRGNDSSSNAPPAKKPSEANPNVQSKSSKRKRLRRNACTARPGPKPDGQKLHVCQDFLKFRCRRGQHCDFLHMKPDKRPAKDDSPVDGGIPSIFTKVIKVCRGFIHNMCPQGNDCLFYHPTLEIKDGVAENLTWFAVCKNLFSDSCSSFKCRFFHVLKHDKEVYLMRGEISPELVEAAVCKCFLEKLTLIGAAPYCKAFLRGLCKLQNCQLRHLSEEEFKDEVFYEIQDEFELLLGPPESRPQVGDGFQVPVPLNDNSGMLGPFHYSAAPVEDSIMEARMEQNYPRDPNILMQEIHDLRNEHITMRRNLEGQVVNLENENTQLRTQLHTLTAANTSLSKEKNNRENTVQQLQNDILKLHKIIDGNISNASSELRKQLEAAKKEAEKAREAFANVNAEMMTESEMEKRKLLAEISNLKAKLVYLQSQTVRGEDVQQLDKKLISGGRDVRDGYSSDGDYQGYSKQAAVLVGNNSHREHGRLESLPTGVSRDELVIHSSGSMYKVSVVGHCQIPHNLEVTGAEIRVFRAPEGKAGTFFTDTRVSQVLEWKHKLCILWLGSNDVVEGITPVDITNQIIEIVKAIERECIAKVLVCLLEPKLNPRGMSPKAYEKVQTSVNSELKRLFKKQVIPFNALYYVMALAPDGVSWSEKGKQIVESKLVSVIRHHLVK